MDREQFLRWIARARDASSQFVKRVSVASGPASNGLVAIGAALAVLFAHHWGIGGLIVLLGFLALIFDAKIERGQLETGSPHTLKARFLKMGPQYLTALGAIIFLAGAAWWVMRSHEAGTLPKAFSLQRLPLATQPGSEPSPAQPARVSLPSVVLLFEQDQLRLYNRDYTDWWLWGDKFNDAAQIENEAAMVPNGMYYAISTALLEQWAAANIGTDGIKSVPFEMYLKSTNAQSSGQKFTARFALRIAVKNGVLDVIVQNRGVTEGGW